MDGADRQQLRSMGHIPFRKRIPEVMGNIHGFNFDALKKLTVKQERIKQKSLCKVVAMQLTFSCLP